MSLRERPISSAVRQSERPPRVLVIDDDLYVRLLLGDLLTNWGYEADVASDGAEGLALFRRGRYDVVLTDLAMADITGLDVAAGVRDRDRSVSVILFTALMGEVEDAARLGLTVLRKPLDIGDLRQALREAIAGSASA